MSISVRQSQRLDPQILIQAIHKKASEAKYITISVNIKNYLKHSDSFPSSVAFHVSPQN